ncbi:hypothetical protein A2335_02855 [Candidatus Peregrinibacteria bacterium RIFOXYB2_FULL_32_7]|nr:MAG: hypothetical protein A2335_02855 [Candidatus Peregrinibacteria bacterium RIFOXYB2_FULL_32_7]
MEDFVNNTQFGKAKKLIDFAQNIIVISHRSPDADAVGANIALATALKKIGKNVFSACTDALPSNLKFLKGTETFAQKFNSLDFDLLITVDCGSLRQIEFEPEIARFRKTGKTFINFDHHASNDFFGDINIVETKCAATCELLYYFFNFCDFEIDFKQATALLAGIYYDTGRFMHSNTTENNLNIAAELLEKGADFSSIIKNLYKTKSFEQLKLWGLIFNRARINDKNIVISAVTKDDLFECGASNEHINGAIDYLNTVAETKFCLLLTEDDSQIKASVRTQREDLDLSKLSSIFGGGGHKKASGFSISGKIQKDIEVKWRIGV